MNVKKCEKIVKKIMFFGKNEKMTKTGRFFAHTIIGQIKKIYTLFVKTRKNREKSVKNC